MGRQSREGREVGLVRGRKEKERERSKIYYTKEKEAETQKKCASFYFCLFLLALKGKEAHGKLNREYLLIVWICFFDDDDDIIITFGNRSTFINVTDKPHSHTTQQRTFTYNRHGKLKCPYFLLKRNEVFPLILPLSVMTRKAPVSARKFSWLWGRSSALLLLLPGLCVTILQSNYNHKEDLLFFPPLYLSAFCWLSYILLCTALLCSTLVWIFSRQNKRGEEAKKNLFLCEFQGVYFDDGAF